MVYAYMSLIVADRKRGAYNDDESPTPWRIAPEYEGEIKHRLLALAARFAGTSTQNLVEAHWGRPPYTCTFKFAVPEPAIVARFICKRATDKTLDTYEGTPMVGMIAGDNYETRHYLPGIGWVYMQILATLKFEDN